MTTASVLPPPPPVPGAPAETASPTASVPDTVRVASPRRVAGAIAHLAALGVVGPAVFTALFSMLGSGLGLLAALLVGVVVLVAFVYALFAVAWFERARVDGLYGLGLSPLRPRRSAKPGFVGVLHTIWLQAIDPLQWRAVASFSIATVMGLLTLAALAGVAWGLALTVSPIFGWPDTRFLGLFPLQGAAVPLVGVIAVVVAIAAVIGLAILDGVIVRAIFVPSREAQLVEQARTSDTRRAGAVRAAEVERTRIERDLHDGVQPRLVSIGMTLGLAQTKIDDDPEAAKALVAEAHASTKSAITELRQLARGIHASVLEDRGLDAALSALASRSHIPVTLDVRLPRRCGRAAEEAVYFAIAETLTNAAKHSRAAACRVDVRVRDDGSLWARVEDDGLGGASIVPGGGLDGIVNRVTAAGGTARIDSPQGGPTSVEVTVPCAS
ncbi:Signal transduction histidine kinase [Microbacterium sp. ru370.1]|uniref:sensor histidine kinase n=1 Tax=unclassified Microbacterium TaxID=2609290 RepID=UPI0008810AEF|nr:MULTISPECIES: histidine kinase [unclassified Microbacterium]SDP02450.1 Signal transduction histidine kinase [Microbacterium sp. ru370.1]SIT91893.1 Signal transduction histidine kinase [Microbacterium sp. RU1D]